MVKSSVWRLGTTEKPPLASSPACGAEASNGDDAVQVFPDGKSLHESALIKRPSQSAESVILIVCESMGFDIAEVWLRTGPKTHQLINSHLRPSAMNDSIRTRLVGAYNGEERMNNRLSTALCKKSKKENDVVWVTSSADKGIGGCAINDIKTASSVPVCHEVSNTNITIIFFSVHKIIMRPPSLEFLVHMALAAALAMVTDLAQDIPIYTELGAKQKPLSRKLSLSIPLQSPQAINSKSWSARYFQDPENEKKLVPCFEPESSQPEYEEKFSCTGASLNLKWGILRHIEYLTDGGNSWVHTAIMDGNDVVVKTLKPECQDTAIALNEIEAELETHAQLDHPHIVKLAGAGISSKGIRFVVLERLDGGNLSQVLGYETRIRDSKKIKRKKPFSVLIVLGHARDLADALAYLHTKAIPGAMCIHRDLKPDNIGFTAEGTIKIMDFGLAKIVRNASAECIDTFNMSGETGSLRYMAPEVAKALPYNHKCDVHSYGIILWELLSYKKPFGDINRNAFYEKVVYNGDRPLINKRWGKDVVKLLQDCWATDINDRPNFSEIVERIDAMIKKKSRGNLENRQSAWF